MEKLEIKKERKPLLRLPKQEIKKLVQAIESKEITVEDVVKKYNFKNKDTINNWFKTFGNGSMPTDRICLSKELKRQIVFEITSGKLPEAAALKKYLLSPTTLKRILKLYSPEITQSEIKDEMIEQENNPRLERGFNAGIIKELTLKVAALETMIDVAEKEFDIEIRKKSGTKQ